MITEPILFAGITAFLMVRDRATAGLPGFDAVRLLGIVWCTDNRLLERKIVCEIFVCKTAPCCDTDQKILLAARLEVQQHGNPFSGCKANPEGKAAV
jgi:hypothetical protein